MSTKMESELSLLVGKALWACRRAADMATFQFGSRTKTLDYYGRPTEVGEYALHVQCAWRITRREEIVVGNRDLYYPADVADDGLEVPKSFNWDKDPNRRDRLILLFFDQGKEFTVQSVQTAVGGSFRLIFRGGEALDVFPNDSLRHEHWRLLRPTSADRQFVFSGPTNPD